MKSTIKKSLLVAMLCGGQAMAQQTIDQTLTINTNGVNSTEILMKKTSNTYYSLFSNYSGFGIYNSTNNHNILYADINDRVGMGTTSPLAQLDIRNGNILVKNLTNTTGESVPMIMQSLSFGNYTTFGTSINTFTQNGGSNSYALQFFTQENYLNGLVEKMRISAEGNVGIGTATPQEKLSVNGKIRAKEIKVETANWPDYVFEEGYQNQSLAEIEQFIKANKHLPGVPTAKQVEQEGLELGEMNKILLKKVEELTLLLIEKDKELKKEKEENNARLNKIEKWIKNKK